MCFIAINKWNTMCEAHHCPIHWKLLVIPLCWNPVIYTFSWKFPSWFCISISQNIWISDLSFPFSCYTCYSCHEPWQWNTFQKTWSFLLFSFSFSFSFLSPFPLPFPLFLNTVRCYYIFTGLGKRFAAASCRKSHWVEGHPAWALGQQWEVEQLQTSWPFTAGPSLATIALF